MVLLMVTGSWAHIILGSRQASIGWRGWRVGRFGVRIIQLGLRLFRGYGRGPSLHLERGEGLWQQNRKKDFLFGIGGVGVTPTVLPPRRLPSRRYSPITRLHTLIRTRIREFLSPFHPSSFLWAAPR